MEKCKLFVLDVLGQPGYIYRSYLMS